MHEDPGLRSVWRITVYCPVAAATVAAVARGEFGPLEFDRGCAGILRHIEESADLGNFGPYRGVCEIVAGVEAFTPQAGAHPTVGRAGERTLSPTLAVTTYVPGSVGAGRLREWLDALAALHPWELPVIETAEVRLYRPAPIGVP